MIPFVWIGLILIPVIVPLLAVLARYCQIIFFPRAVFATTSHHEALWNFMVGPAPSANRPELKETRKQVVESQLTTYQVKEGNGNDDVQNTGDICKLKKGDLILPKTMLMTKDDNEGHNSDNGDTNRPVCAICVSPYRARDQICWGSHMDCNHCFHKNCIKPWLLNHTECPCCRLPFLKVDNCDSEKILSDQREAENDATFQQMLANLRDSFQSRQAIHDEEEEATTLDTSTSSKQTEEEVVAAGDRPQQQYNHQHHHHQESLCVLVDKIMGDDEAGTDLVDVELGTQSDEQEEHDSNQVEGRSSFPAAARIR